MDSISTGKDQMHGIIAELVHQLKSDVEDRRISALADLSEILRYPAAPKKKSDGQIDHDFYSQIFGIDCYREVNEVESSFILSQLSEIAQSPKKSSGVFYCMGLLRSFPAFESLSKIILNESIEFSEEELYQITVAWEDLLIFLMDQQKDAKSDFGVPIELVLTRLDRLSKGKKGTFSKRIRDLKSSVRRMRLTSL